MKRSVLMGAVAVTAASALAACGSAPQDEASSGSASAGGDASDFLACMVSDAGGFDDQSFNQTSYEGLQQAVEELGVEEATAQSSSDSDYAPNVDSMVQQGCNIIVGVGFLLEDPIQAAAEANPDTQFAVVDSSFTDADFNPVTLDNAKPLLFNTAEAAYLAGYLAAGMTQTGTVATFGGMQIPSVTIFMDGFADGVTRYNEDNGTSVTLLGWNKDEQTGAFTGDFDNQANGQQQAEQFLQQGADIIMPVAGPVGLGAAAAIQAAGNASMVWVDTDGYESTSYGDIILTSVVKEMNTAVYEAIASDVDGTFTSEAYVGTLENGGVDIAPYHDFESDVPAELSSAIDDLRDQIISGELVVESPSTP